MSNATKTVVACLVFLGVFAVIANVTHDTGWLFTGAVLLVVGATVRVRELEERIKQLEARK